MGCCGSTPEWSYVDTPSLDGRVALVTGGNSGIGLEAARLLAARGATVILCCRDAARGEAAKSQALAAIDGAAVPPERIVVGTVDLASLQSIRDFTAAASRSDDATPLAAALRGGLDVVICNAGVMDLEAFTKSPDGFEMQWATNHLGHYALVGSLLPLLRKKAAAEGGAAPRPRVVPVASGYARQGRFADPAQLAAFDFTFADGKYHAGDVYKDTKQANVLFAAELRRRHGAWLDVVACHPGVCATNLFRHNGYSKFDCLFQSAEAGALIEVRAATDPSLAGPGGKQNDPELYVGTGPNGGMKGTPTLEKPAAKCVQADLAAALWTATAAATGIDY